MSRANQRDAILAFVATLVVMTVIVQFVKFGIVGISNTLITFIVYTILLKVFGVWYIAASAIGLSGTAATKLPPSAMNTFV